LIEHIKEKSRPVSSVYASLVALKSTVLTFSKHVRFKLLPSKKGESGCGCVTCVTLVDNDNFQVKFNVSLLTTGLDPHKFGEFWRVGFTNIYPFRNHFPLFFNILISIAERSYLLKSARTVDGVYGMQHRAISESFH